LPFVAEVQVTPIDPGHQISAQTQDLTDGTKITLHISHNGETVVAQGIVAYSRKGTGMGVGFTFMEPSSVSILDTWLSDLRA